MWTVFISGEKSVWVCLVIQSCPNLWRREYSSGFPFPLPGDLLDSEIEPASPVSPAFQADCLPAEPSGKPLCLAVFSPVLWLLLLYPLWLGVRRGKIKGKELSVTLRARTAGVRCERPLPGRCPHVAFSLYVASPETMVWEDHGWSSVMGDTVSGWEIPAPGSYCPPPPTLVTRAGAHLLQLGSILSWQFKLNCLPWYLWKERPAQTAALGSLSILINSSSPSLPFRIFQRTFRQWCLCFPNSKGHSRVLQEHFHPFLLCSSSTGAAQLAWSKNKKPPSSSHKERREHTGHRVSCCKGILTPRHPQTSSSWRWGMGQGVGHSLSTSYVDGLATSLERIICLLEVLRWNSAKIGKVPLNILSEWEGNPMF